MPLARSKLTAQNQISVPLKVRQKLGLHAGSVLEWDEEGSSVVVRRAGKYSSLDIHKMLFAEGPPKKRTIEQLKEGIQKRMREKYARD
jgi:AbrB family looped-hinge helix DNA binding protein